MNMTPIKGPIVQLSLPTPRSLHVRVDRPYRWPISWISTWRTMWPSVSSCSPSNPGSAGGRARPCWAAERRRRPCGGQADALEQAEQVEILLAAHLVEHVLGRKIVDR